MLLAADRSYLFVPGDRPERFDKAWMSEADRVIVDLEDTVAPARKDAARAAVAAWLSADKPVVLRLNAAGTPWFEADRALAARPGVAALMLAKTESAAQLAGLGAGQRLIPLIESAVGFANLHEIAHAPGVLRLAFGALDFQLDLNMHATYDELLYFRSQLVLTSRLAGLAAPIDSPSVGLDAPFELEAQARAARRLGFGAKLCIHPRQLALVNAGFGVTASERAWAESVLVAAAQSDGAAVALDGQMIDRPVILRAQAMLAGAGLVQPQISSQPPNPTEPP